MKHKGLNQLLCAAIVNPQFRETLLDSPMRALEVGYLDYTFPLTPEERDLVGGIQVQRLEDFATKVHCWIQAGGNGHNGHNGHSSRWERW